MATKKNMNESASGANSTKYENKTAKDAKLDAKRKELTERALANVAGCDKVKAAISTAKERSEAIKKLNETARGANAAVKAYKGSVSGCVRSLFASAEKGEVIGGENVRELLKEYGGAHAKSKRAFCDAYGKHFGEVLKIGQTEVRTHKTGKHAGETYEFTYRCSESALIRIMREECAQFLRTHE